MAFQFARPPDFARTRGHPKVTQEALSSRKKNAQNAQSLGRYLGNMNRQSALCASRTGLRGPPRGLPIPFSQFRAGLKLPLHGSGGLIPPVNGLSYVRSRKPFAICICQKRSRNSPAISTYTIRALNLFWNQHIEKNRGDPLASLPPCARALCKQKRSIRGRHGFPLTSFPIPLRWPLVLPA